MTDTTGGKAALGVVCLGKLQTQLTEVLVIEEIDGVEVRNLPRQAKVQGREVEASSRGAGIQIYSVSGLGLEEGGYQA
eukprot:s267_g11.t1